MRKYLTLALTALVAVPVLAVSAALPETAAVTKTADFIKTTQQPDGGFGGFGDGQSYDAIIGLRSAGIDVSTVATDGKTPVDFIIDRADDASPASSAAKTAIAARAAGLDPEDVGGTDLIAAIEDAYASETGLYEPGAFSQATIVLGLLCTEHDVPTNAITALRALQLPSGAWGFDTTSDPDTTALAVQALAAADVPVTDPAVAAALSYIAGTQGNDGGWGFDPSESNANSTAYIVQALLALELDPESATYTKDGVNPVQYLLSQQLDDGSFAGFDPAYAANQVLPALAGRTYCDAADTPLADGSTPTPTATAAPSETVSPTTTPPPSVTSTATPTATLPATSTSTPTSTSTATATATSTSTATPTATRTSTPTRTPTRTATRAATATRSPIPPKTGSGAMSDGSGGAGTTPLLALALVAMAAGGAGLVAASRRK